MKNLGLLHQARLEKIDQLKERENKRLIHKKTVLVVLEPALCKVIVGRLRLDEMEQVIEFAGVDAVIEFLQTGHARGIAEAIESKGAEEVAKLLSGGERDQFLLGLLGKRLFSEILTQEAQQGGKRLLDLEEEKKRELVYFLDDAATEHFLLLLQKSHPQSFLGRVRPELREKLILEFYKNPATALAGWQRMDESTRDNFLWQKTPQVLASLYLADSKLFEKSFPDSPLTRQGGWDSTQFKDLSPGEVPVRLSLFAETLQGLQMDQAYLDRVFTHNQWTRIISRFITLRSEEFFNFFEPEVRKILWYAAGEANLQTIYKRLSAKEKLDILEGAQDQVLRLLCSEIDWLAQEAKEGRLLDLAGHLLLLLKQGNQLESKAGLRKRVAMDPNLRQYRLDSLAEFFASPRGKKLLGKVSFILAETQVHFEAVVCLNEAVAPLRAQAELQEARFIEVDSLLDFSLLDLLKKGSLDLKKYEQMQGEIEKKIEKAKAKLLDSGKSDPVGVYASETLLLMVQLTHKAMQNQLDAGMLPQLDERQQAKTRILDQVKERIARLEQTLKTAEERLPGLRSRNRVLAQSFKELKQETQNRLSHLQGRLKLYGEYQQRLKALEVEKRKLAAAQKKLFRQFFQLIAPPMLNRLTRLPGTLSKLVSGLKKTFNPEEAQRRRKIFRFSEEQFQQLTKRDIVFLTEDPILKGFISTCLKIDGLDNRFLRVLAPQDLSFGVEILFVGADLIHQDFSAMVEPKFQVPLVDPNFYEALKLNEGKKQGMRKSLQKYKNALVELKRYLETEGGNLKKMAVIVKSREREVQRNREKEQELKLILSQEVKSLRALKAEEEGLEVKLALVDQQFEQAKTSIEAALSKEGEEKVTILKEQAQPFSGSLSQDLLQLNKQLAGLMMIQTIKESSGIVSQKTQEGLRLKLEANSRLPGGKAALKELTLASDGGVLSEEILRTLEPACKDYFGQAVHLKQTPFAKVENEMAEQESRPQMVIFIGDDSANHLSSFKERFFHLKACGAQSHFALITPYPTDPLSADLERNLTVLKDLCFVANSQLEDFTNPSVIHPFLQSLVPG